MPEKVSAGGLLDSLKRTFRLGQKESLEVPPAGATPPVVSVETSAATEAPPAQEQAPAPEPTAVAPVGELPDWLRGGQGEAEVSASLPEPEAPAVVVPAVVETPVPAPETPTALPVVEAPMVEAPAVAVAAEAKVEVDPFATNREFNGYMETIRQAQAVLASGTALNLEEQRKALISVARANSLLPQLPSEVFKSVLLMRAVAANNPNFGRNDFQLEMLAAMNVIKTGTAVKG